ncbi:MAG: MipA/OmpV family protein [Alphaproteobacteria bacterium]|nr:MipA/OmpV family protein [Alphaproteobacteria bacterium]
MNLVRAFLLLSLCAAPAFASANDAMRRQTTIGAFGIIVPQFEGSARYRYFLIPTIDFQYGPYFISMMRGIGLSLPLNESRTLIITPTVHFRRKRDLSTDFDIGNDATSIRPTANIELMYAFAPGWALTARITEGMASDNFGMVLNTGVRWGTRLTDDIMFSMFGGIAFADKNYNQSYFGINASEAMRYGLLPHSASAGPKNISAGSHVRYSFTQNWSLDVMVRVHRLLIPSPLIEQKNQIIIGTGVSYRF